MNFHDRTKFIVFELSSFVSVNKRTLVVGTGQWCTSAPYFASSYEGSEQEDSMHFYKIRTSILIMRIYKSMAVARAS